MKKNVSRESECVLLKNADLFAPKAIGIRNILMAAGKIVAVGAEETEEAALSLGCEIIDLDGSLVVPGLVDQHVHITGGGGEHGFRSRISALSPKELFAAGVTSVVGTLGTDSLTRSVHSLVAQAKSFREQGLSAWCLTGAYSIDSPTVTGSVREDICFIEEIIGCKIAISDHRCSAPTWQELARLASEVRFAALTSGKAGELHIHTGKGKDGLSPVFEVLDRTDLPILHFRPTHCENVFSESLEFARRGGYIDLTADEEPDATADLIIKALDDGVDISQITVSSDAGGSVPVWNDRGEMTGMSVGTPSSLLPVIRSLVIDKGMSLQYALRPFTSSPADALLLDEAGKGRIAPGMDADLLVLDDDFSLREVFAGGEARV